MSTYFWTNKLVKLSLLAYSVCIFKQEPHMILEIMHIYLTENTKGSNSFDPTKYINIINFLLLFLFFICYQNEITNKK